MRFFLKYLANERLQKALPFLRQSSAHVFFQLVSMAMPFFLLPITTHYMMPHDYGRFALYMVMAGFIAPVVSMGVDQVFAYGYFKRTVEQRAELVSSYILTMLIVALGLEVVLVGVGLTMSGMLDMSQKALATMGVYAALLFLPLLGQTVAFMEKNLLLQGVFIVGRILIAYLVSLPLMIFVTTNWYVLLAGQFVALTILSIVALRYLWSKNLLSGLKLSRAAVMEILGVGGPMVFLMLASAMVGFVDRMVVQYFLGTDGVGLYAIPYSMMGAVMMLLIALSRGVAPTVIRLASERTPEGLHMVVKVFFGYWAAIIVVFLVAALLGGPVFKLLTSEAYAQGAKLVPALALAFMFNTLFMFNSSLLVLEKKTGLLAVLSILAGVLNAGLNWEMVPGFGLLGAAWANVIAFGVLSFVTFGVMLRYVPFPWGQVGREVAELRHAAYEKLGRRLGRGRK